MAANASGPLRHRYGAPRDLVIGARLVLADGTRAKTGGKVVKNVAGYDLARLLCGSLGSLAVITELAFRLHPVPEASRTVLLETRDAAEAARFAAATRSGGLTPSVAGDRVARRARRGPVRLEPTRRRRSRPSRRQPTTRRRRC